MKNCSQSNLVRFLRHSPVATAIYQGSELRIAFANDAMLEVWGSDQKIIGGLFREVFPGFAEAGFADALERVWCSGRSHIGIGVPALIGSVEKALRFFDFEYKAVVENGHTVAILHTSVDVTKRIEASANAAPGDSDLNAKEQLETLAYMLNHDAKNPLAVAKMAVDFMLRNQNDQVQPDPKWFPILKDALRSLENIIDQTYQLSQTASCDTSTRAFSLSQELPEWWKELRSQRPNEEMELVLGRLLPLRSPRARVKQVFYSLMDVSIKNCADIRPLQLEIFSEPVDQWVVYSFRDNRWGLSRGELAFFSKEFSGASLRNEARRYGLGLFQTNQLMKALGGRLSISSEEGKGACVRLYFPVG